LEGGVGEKGKGGRRSTGQGRRRRWEEEEEEEGEEEEEEEEEQKEGGGSSRLGKGFKKNFDLILAFYIPPEDR
jgi:hypothetical protein